MLPVDAVLNSSWSSSPSSHLPSSRLTPQHSQQTATLFALGAHQQQQQQESQSRAPSFLFGDTPPASMGRPISLLEHHQQRLQDASGASPLGILRRSQSGGDRDASPATGMANKSVHWSPQLITSEQQAPTATVNGSLQQASSECPPTPPPQITADTSSFGSFLWRQQTSVAQQQKQAIRNWPLDEGYSGGPPLRSLTDSDYDPFETSSDSRYGNNSSRLPSTTTPQQPSSSSASACLQQNGVSHAPRIRRLDEDFDGDGAYVNGAQRVGDSGNGSMFSTLWSYLFGWR